MADNNPPLPSTSVLPLLLASNRWVYTDGVM